MRCSGATPSWRTILSIVASTGALTLCHSFVGPVNEGPEQRHKDSDRSAGGVGGHKPSIRPATARTPVTTGHLSLK